jgi:glycosyltransferase involved in cell wall biosynthesis
MDSPWQGTVAQRLARFRLAGLVKRLDLAVTSGDRSYQYARHIGVPENRIRSGYYGFDNQLFCGVASERSVAAGGWPRQFLFVGRYVPDKDLATLVKAYSLYRTSVSRPWGLTCCGAGVDAELLKGITGVVDAGFVPPRELPSVFRGHGAFVLPSLFEPWGVVIAEAAASGLPVVCTTACGAGVDLVRPYYNGLTVTTQDAPELARAMRWIHEHESELPKMGQRGQALAQPYSAEAWATRWYNYFRELLADATPQVA